MTQGFRSGHALAPAHAHRKRDSCATGGFYKSPSAGQTIPYTTPVNITWDTSCLNTSAVDIYLYAPSLEATRIHEWANVDFKNGGYNTTIQPKWYNSTSSIQLQFAILPAGTPPFMATLPAGPLFTATYTKPTSGEVPSAADTTSGGAVVENVNNMPKSGGHSSGKVAAGVLVPLLLLIGLGVAYYIKRNRTKGKEKRKRWSEAIDKRMSTISTDWKSVSAAGATAAIRNSMAVSNGTGNRNSAFSFGAIRPSSEATAVEGGQAGIGSHAVYGEKTSIDLSAPHMAQLRPGVRASAFAGRVSRVSFAPDNRPPSEARRTRAFHTGYVPPLPGTEDPAVVSPTQAAGPFSLTAEDIRTRMSGEESAARPSFDEVIMPALSMMRNGGERSSSTDELMFPPALPSPPPPTHAAPQSSVVGMMPMQPMPANMMSPDEMLRAYAERRAVGSPPTVGAAPTFPTPALNYNGNGMRTLYSPTTPDSAPMAMPTPMTLNVLSSPVSPESMYPNSAEVFVGGFRESVAPTMHTDDSRYADEDYHGEFGTAE
ncbi:hypothetical protein B0H21DRAFT_77406 [Amylocystis lapponica]|nr:hypothetical protein B0H21DRAFT_77406 [Amylocystis lapponica]